MSRQRKSEILSSGKVHRDRVISRFQKASNPGATPYPEQDFHFSVTSACSQNAASGVGLKVCKVVIVGDVGIGKTCLVQKFCHGEFDNDYKATIGVDFEVEKFSILSNPFTLQVWDTAGQERFKAIAASYYRGAHALLVACDLSDLSSLHTTQQWMNDAVDVMDDPFVFLVGLKKDLVAEAALAETCGICEDMARQLGAEFWPTSAKTGEDVRELFFRVSCLVFNRQVRTDVDQSSGAPQRSIGSFGTVKIEKRRTDDLLERIKKPQCCT